MFPACVDVSVNSSDERVGVSLSEQPFGVSLIVSFMTIV